MITAKEQVAHYCNRYAVFCTGANERGECSTTVCISQWRIEILKGGDTK